MNYDKALLTFARLLFVLALVVFGVQVGGCAGTAALKSAAECTVKEVAKKCAPECVRCVCNAAQKCATESAIKCLVPTK